MHPSCYCRGMSAKELMLHMHAESGYHSIHTYTHLQNVIDASSGS